MTTIHFLSCALSTLLFASFISADCECGYKVNNTLYTDLIETDFLHLPSITNDIDWQPQNYTVTPADARGPYGKNASLSNVLANPLKSQYDWAGDGVNGGDAGLQLYVRGSAQGLDSLIPMAELVTTRDDVLYGSFRAGMKFTPVNGTCGAFFWYWNDTQEIDIEYLSTSQNHTSHPINLVLQSLQSAQAGFNAAATGTFDVHSLPFDPTTKFHEYRFDWAPGSVAFYTDGMLLDSMTQDVPTAPGHLTLSHWSTGNPNWSGGPPVTDAVLTVEYVKGYFNSSDAARQADWKARCKNIEAVNATCAVPEMAEAPDGNSSAKTFFFSTQKNMTGNQTVFGSKQKSDGGQRLGLQILWTFVLTLVLGVSMETMVCGA